MLKNISIGMYYPGQSPLHRLQARTKLLLLLGIAVWLAIGNQREWHFAPFIAVVVLVGLATALARISPLEMWRRLWLLIVFSVIGIGPALFGQQNDARPLSTLGPYFLAATPVYIALFVLDGIAVVSLLLLLLVRMMPALDTLRHQRWFRIVHRLRILYLLLILVVTLALLYLQKAITGPHMPLGPFIISYGGTWVVASVFVGLLALYAFSVLLTMTTSPIALVEGISLLLAPLRRLHLPVDDFALMILLALRFIPTLLEEVEQLIKAQTARGADLGSGTAHARLSSFVALFLPLIQAIFRRASELATALEARGYEVEGKQTMLHETSFGLADFIAAIFVVLVSIGTLIV